MQLENPFFLFLLIIIPCLITAYYWLSNRKKSVIRVSSLHIIKESQGKLSWIKRFLPGILLLLSIVSVIIALTDPIATYSFLYDRKTYIVAMDTSGSMMAEDIEPNRLRVMKNAVNNFVQENIRYSARIGLVKFDYFATTILSPTSDGKFLTAGIDSLVAYGGTAMGEGLIKSLNLIFPKGSILPDAEITSENLDQIGHHYDTGTNESAVIILISDGDNTIGIDPLKVARVADNLGVRIYTIGLGTKNSLLNIGGSMVNVDINEELLKTVANITGGEYWKAEDEKALNNVYGNISSKLSLERTTANLSWLFSAIAAICMITAFVLSILWRGIV